GAGDAAASGTMLERDGEPTVPVFDAMEEGACSNGAFAQGCAGIGIQQERLATAEGDFDRLGEIVAPDSARGHPRFRGAGNLENGFERLALRIWLRRGAEPAFGPVDHVTLAGQKHAGDAHDEDHDSRDAACGEMAPE